MKLTMQIYLFLSLMAVCSARENKLHTDKPEKAGISSNRLRRLNALMQKYIDERKLPGMITMVARHGKLVYYEKYGLMDVDKPMALNAIFRIASMTKPITSVAAMILYEQSLFRLEDPVSKYIPAFRDLRVFSSKDQNGEIHLVNQIRPMTIRDLFMHTSGLGSGWGDSPVDSMYRTTNLSAGTLQDMVEKLANIPLLYQPGTRWNYGRSTDVLGYLVQVISGKPLDVFFREKIFLPLKMQDTDYYVSKEKLDRVMAVYSLDDSVGMKIIVPDTGDISKPVRFLSGNGGLFSTCSDYMTFSQMLLNKGKYNSVRLLQPQNVELMTSNHITHELLPDDDFFGPLLSDMGFGFGFAVLRDSRQTNTVGSAGAYWWSGSANTYFFIDPKEDLILIFMTQFVPNFYYPVFREFKELVYESIMDLDK
jgi:CubicO group peptidase (beta-lactamase class C family)